ncbi:hypothetical protein F4813DRAFT_400965 [Daldinia decipiens]|uniref:uncharacterized protein n=1 Tax=Daldinia decipiens TaxID=326647 RepID=UPI0020C26110|nr:uncharacterized protein F4813DRAFT_400965 [Daldinia decipiens]KAI1652508.1 hypothetical protein F4813DRAFT_400965 [Daldinia decipiens]
MSSEPRALPFDYRLLPLDRSKKEIRLLKLKLEGTLHSWRQTFNSGITNSDLEPQLNENLDLERPAECELLKASLEASPDFHALSYVWGPSTKSMRLILRVNNHYPDIPLGTTDSSETFEVEITDNLHLGLIHYRGSKSDIGHLLIWVDAICINQKDNNEKSWQGSDDARNM